jgi:hypothetical protein
MVSPGAHGLEYWGEDTLGQAESNHHVATVFVIPEKPTVSITSDQATNAYVLGEPASVSVATNEPASVLLTDPSGLHEAVPTRALGDFTIMRTAVDRCGDTMTASFAYSVAYAAQIAHLAVRPAVLGRAGATISYRETHAATTTFVVQRRLPGTRRARYEDVAHFRHQDLAGLNRLHFSGRVAGAGPAAYVWFRISR